MKSDRSMNGMLENRSHRKGLMQSRALAPKKSSRSRSTRRSQAYKLRVLFIEEEGGWSAQVLEHDIATQADTLQELFYEVERILVSHVALADAEGRPPFNGIPPAREKYWEIFNNSQISIKRPSAGLKLKRTLQPIFESDIRIAEKVAA